MSARVFISFRSSDGADQAAALARELGARFGEARVFADRIDLPIGERWREANAGTSPGGPVLLVLVTPLYLGALDAVGGRSIDSAADPVRDQLGAGIAAGARIVLLLCDGVDAMPATNDLPEPFKQLGDMPWARLRSHAWGEDIEHLCEVLVGEGLVPSVPAVAVPSAAEMQQAEPSAVAPSDGAPSTAATPAAATPAAVSSIAASSEAAYDDTGPVTTPMPLDHAGYAATATAPIAPSRRRALTIGLLVAVVAGWSALRWRRRHAADLSGNWRAAIGARGAASARDAEPVAITVVQSGDTLRLASSAVEVTHDPAWQGDRDLWRQRYGVELRRVFYRGEGKVIGEPEDGSQAVELLAFATQDAASSATRKARAIERPPGWPHGATVRRIDIAMHIVADGEEADAIDAGRLRAIVDADDERMRGRLWLDREQAERTVDIRRG